MSAPTKFDEALAAFKLGEVNTHVLRCADLAKLAGLSESEAEQRITQAMPRPPRRGEVERAISKAYSTTFTGTGTTYAKPMKPQPKPMTQRAIVALGDGWTEADLFESSPRKMPEETPGKVDLLALLDADLWANDETLFIGGQYDTRTRSVSEWRNLFTMGAELPNFICPNPMKTEGAKLADGKTSFRCDAAVADFRFAVLEMDGIPPDEQIAFWHGLPSLPIVAMIHSGSKSIHCWVRVDCQDKAEWDAKVKGELFNRLLVPLGVDPACSNPARLSRTAGAWRAEKKAFQKLLFLDPNAGRSGA